MVFDGAARRGSEEGDAGAGSRPVAMGCAARDRGPWSGARWRAGAQPTRADLSILFDVDQVIVERGVLIGAALACQRTWT